MKFRNLYSWHVMPEIEKGNTVYVLDRKAREIYAANDLTVNEAFAVIKMADDGRDRFDFWIEEEEVEKDA